MKKNNIYILSAIVSVVLLAYVLYNLDWDILRVAFSDIHWDWLGLALMAYIVNILLRALRFTNLIYSRPVKWLELIPVSALHNILMYILPAKTGDITYIFIAKNRLDLSLTEGTATLLAARYYDFSVVALILAILLPFSKNAMPVWIFESSIVFCLLILIGTMGILTFLKFSKPPLESVSLLTDVQDTGTPTLQKIRAAWNKFIAGLREIQSHGAHGRVVLITAGIWLCIYSNFYFTFIRGIKHTK